MATEFDRHVVVDLLLTPVSFAMEMVGLTLAALSALDILGGWGYVAGLACALGSLGWGITRIILNPDKVVGESLQKRRDRLEKEKKSKLDEFEELLTENKDWEVRRPFRELVAIRNEFIKLHPSINESLQNEIEEQFTELFDTCVKLLQGAHGHLLTIRETEVERIKAPFLKRRASALKKVAGSVEHMTNVVAGIAEDNEDDQGKSMAVLQDDLKVKLDMMRAVDQEMEKFSSDFLKQ